MDDVRPSTAMWACLLAVSAVVGLSDPIAIPGAVSTAAVGTVALVTWLTDFRKFKISWVALVIALFACASVLWAGSSEGFQSSLALLLATLSAFVLATYCSPASAVRWLSIGFKVIAVITLAMWAVGAGIESRWPNVGSLIGPYAQKNILGSVLVLGFLANLYSKPRSVTRQTALWKIVWALGFIALIVGTRSATAIVLTLATSVLWLAMRLWEQRPVSSRHTQVILTGVGVGLAIPLIAANADNILGLFGKDPTLSGRSRIWTGTIAAWHQRPLAGFGWGAAYGDQDAAANVINSYTGWIVPSSHNGYLSTLLQTGVIGLALLGVLVLTVLVRTFAEAVTSGTAEQRWMFQLAVVFVVNNFFDTRVEGLDWFLFVAVAAWSGRRVLSANNAPALNEPARDNKLRSYAQLTADSRNQ